MDKFIWGVAAGWLLAVTAHSFDALLTFQEVLK